MNKTRFLIVVFALFVFFAYVIPLSYAHCPSHSCPGNKGDEEDSEDDCIGCCSGGGGVGMPNMMVNMGNLNFMIKDTPIAYTPAMGPEVRFKMVYNSMSQNAGLLGYYWTHSYNVFLAFDGSNVIVNRGDGREDTYYCPAYGLCEGPIETTHDTLTKNPDDTYTLETKDHTKYGFDSSGKLEEIADRYDKTLDLVYNDTGLYQLIDAVGRTTTIDYNDTNLIEKITLPDGRHADFVYNGEDLVQVTDEAGQPTDYSVDLNHLIGSVSTPKTSVNVEYQYGYRIWKVIGDGMSNPINRVYNYNFGAHSVTDAGGCLTAYPSAVFLSASGCCGFRATGRNSSCGSSPTAWGYDDDGNRNYVKIGTNSQETFYDFDAHGNKIHEKDPMGYETFYTYDSRNNLTSVTDPRGKVTEYVYGDSDILLSVTEKDPQDNILSQITYEYTDPSFPYLKTSMTDANNKTTTYTYDGYGRLQTIDAPGLDPVTFGYNDLNDRKTSMTNTSGTTTYEYDDLDRIRKITHPDGTYREYTYDCCDLQSVRDENGKITGYEYDELGRLTKVIDPEHGETNPTIYEYDEVGNLRYLTDAKGNTTEYVYDNANRLTDIIYPLGDSEHYTYDEYGNIETKTDGKGVITTYTYDANNRLIKVVPGEVQQ